MQIRDNKRHQTSIDIHAATGYNTVHDADCRDPRLGFIACALRFPKQENRVIDVVGSGTVWRTVVAILHRHLQIEIVLFVQ